MRMLTDRNKVITVTDKDTETGTMDKTAAHTEGVLHRAFSIFILNTEGSLLLQQRADNKYHSGGLWTNTCCSHPMPGEDTNSAASRRLLEEMGFQCPLEHVFSFLYKADVGGGMTEHEFDHVYLGYYNDLPFFNPDEVKAIRYVALDEIKEMLAKEPTSFTAWMHIAFPRFYDHIEAGAKS